METANSAKLRERTICNVTLKANIRKSFAPGSVFADTWTESNEDKLSVVDQGVSVINILMAMVTMDET